MLKGVNWIAVLIAFVLLEAVGYLWYGMVFSKAWVAEMNAIGLKPDMSSGAQTTSLIEGAVLILVQVLGLSWLIGKAGANSLQSGLMAGLCARVFLGLTAQAMELVVEGLCTNVLA